MSRRPALTWAATSVPEIRRQWCTALHRVIDRFTEDGLAPTDEPDTPGQRRKQRVQNKLAGELQIMKAETQALAEAELFWVARDMVDLAVSASENLPEWTPALAAPTPNGLLLWAKPAGTVPYGPKTTATTDVPWDGVGWFLRPDGMLQLTPASRLTKHPELITGFNVTTPLWAAHSIVIDPRQPRSEEANGTEDAHPFVSVIGAAWLLMGQPGLTETRAITDTPTRAPRGAAAPSADPATRPNVTIVELRRPTRQAHASEQPAGREYSRRFWVGGHWRQQACGPNHSQRRPTFVAPYIKGPQDKPLATDRVHVWRR